MWKMHPLSWSLVTLNGLITNAKPFFANFILLSQYFKLNKNRENSMESDVLLQYWVSNMSDFFHAKTKKFQQNWNFFKIIFNIIQNNVIKYSRDIYTLICTSGENRSICWEVYIFQHMTIHVHPCGKEWTYLFSLYISSNVEGEPL